MPAEVVRIGAKTGDVLPPDPITLDVTDAKVPEASAACWQALRASRNPQFVRVQDLACIRNAGENPTQLTAAVLKYWLNRLVVFVKVSKEGEVRRVSAPAWVIGDMMAAPHPALDSVDHVSK
jgi:hypothetical protein